MGNLPAVLPRLRAVCDPLSYAVNELRQVPLAAPYRLRRSGLTAYVRHHSPDGDALASVFTGARFDPPPAVLPLLAGLGAAPRAVDLAAGTGYFALWVLGRWPTAVVTGVEADELAALMAKRAARANDRLATWRVVIASPSDALHGAGLGAMASATLVRLGPGAQGELLARAPRAVVAVLDGGSGSREGLPPGWRAVPGPVVSWAWRASRAP